MSTLISKKKLYKSTKEKANILTEAFANVSSSRNYSEALHHIKNILSLKKLQNLTEYFSEN